MNCRNHNLPLFLPKTFQKIDRVNELLPFPSNSVEKTETSIAWVGNCWSFPPAINRWSQQEWTQLGVSLLYTKTRTTVLFFAFFIYFMASFMLVCVFYPYNKKILFITSQRFDASHFLFVTLHCATFWQYFKSLKDRATIFS